ncbi:MULTISPECIES: TetR/AcrR family transcriptional regulator [Actinoalloteichus]|uniref:Transcriptional regulator, TetR family n=1 Tax=Actinoalloteichus fjordicus TaxID=1612552 RepID=A0AAC9LD52_9PSEU|nr:MULTISPECIES: TetR/AcrR family transcriptional regulator [Actinoalloteichus]APU14679.1 transcriptional regulator, TetR family [Actinoalloteichus fjordicus]APU20647.1 transcriptional regulator, TetR family [Actinoalloteichus sp. GBA129-24]
MTFGTADDQACPGLPPAGRRPRRDAERNRRRIIAAAREAFADQGMDVPMEEIARRAEVGVGTLYRRFETRVDLVEAVFLAKTHEYLAAAEEGLTAPDGWSGFVGYLTRMCELQAADRSLTDVLTVTLPDCPTMARVRRQLHEAQQALLERAQREGSLRADLVAADVVLLLLANAGVVQATGGTAPDAWRRTLALMLAALPVGDGPPLPCPQVSERLMSAFQAPRTGRKPGLPELR